MDLSGSLPRWMVLKQAVRENSLSPSLLTQGQSKPSFKRMSRGGSSWSSLDPTDPRMGWEHELRPHRCLSNHLPLTVAYLGKPESPRMWPQSATTWLARALEKQVPPWKRRGFCSSSQQDPAFPVTFIPTPSEFVRVPRSQAEVSVPRELFSGVNDKSPQMTTASPVSLADARRVIH